VVVWRHTVIARVPGRVRGSADCGSPCLRTSVICVFDPHIAPAGRRPSPKQPGTWVEQAMILCDSRVQSVPGLCPIRALACPCAPELGVTRPVPGARPTGQLRLRCAVQTRSQRICHSSHRRGYEFIAPRAGLRQVRSARQDVHWMSCRASPIAATSRTCPAPASRILVQHAG
jgi:hypothetical protein